MACCLIIAYLAGRAYDQLLHLAIFLGLRAAPPRWRGETLAQRLRRRAYKPDPAVARDL